MTRYRRSTSIGSATPWIAMLGIVLGGAAAIPAAAQADGATATGTVVWTMHYEQAGDFGGEDGDTWSQDGMGLFDLRLERRGATWVDAGSTYEASDEGAWADGNPAFPLDVGPDPVALTMLDCFIVGHRAVSEASGRFADLPAMSVSKQLTLDTDEQAGTVTLIARVPFPGTTWTSTYVGGDCPDYLQGTITMEDSIAGEAYPRCPLADIAPNGRIDTAGSRLVIDCSDHRDGVTPNGLATYSESSNMTGNLVLGP
jgi:hypothetical protein